MKKLHLVTSIQAPREKVWNVMLEDATYRDWTSAFMAGSYYRGNWELDSKILFLAPDPQTKEEGGMVAHIVANRLHEFISIQHLGMVKDGVEDTESDLVKKWAGAHENYTFNEKDGGTELVIDVDVNDDDMAFMETSWEKALERLKELAESI